jgi:hypothetical protein
MASSEPYPEPYLAAIRRGFQFARELGRRCGTVHLLVGISEGHDGAAAALGQGRPLREAVAAAGDAFGDGAGYPHMQAQGAAMLLARQLGQPLDPGHLLTALLEQGTSDVLRALPRPASTPSRSAGRPWPPSAHPPTCRRPRCPSWRPRAPWTARP